MKSLVFVWMFILFTTIAFADSNANPLRDYLPKNFTLLENFPIDSTRTEVVINANSQREIELKCIKHIHGFVAGIGHTKYLVNSNDSLDDELKEVLISTIESQQYGYKLDFLDLPVNGYSYTGQCRVYDIQ